MHFLLWCGMLCAFFPLISLAVEQIASPGPTAAGPPVPSVPPAAQSPATTSPNHPTADSSDFGAEFEQQIALLAVDPTNRRTWNMLATIAFDHHRYFWEFRLKELAGRIEKDGKSAVALDQSLMDEGVPKELGKAWLGFALEQIVVLDPKMRAKNNVDAINLPFRDSYRPLEELAKEWQESTQKNGSLHDPQLDTLTAMYEAKLLPVFVYLNYFNPDHQKEYAAWGNQHQADIAEYFKRFVFIPEGAVPEYARADIDREYNTPQPESRAITPRGELSAEEKDKLEKEVMSLTRKLKAKGNAGDKAGNKTGGARPPNKAEIALELGADLLRLKQYDLATQTLLVARSMFLDSNDPYGVAEAALKLGMTRMSMGKYDEAIYFLGQAARGFGLIPDAPKEHSMALGELAATEATAEHYTDAAMHGRAIFMLFDAHTNDAEIRDRAMSATSNIYGLMFTTIDWNPISGRERDVSDEDFVNNTDVGKPGEKYGRRSSDEDFATFSTFYSNQCRSQVSAEGEDCPLTRHVREQMNAGNFAPAAKYEYFKFVEPYYQPAASSSDQILLQGVLVLGGMRRFHLALCDAYEGDERAYIELLDSVGFGEESDLVNVKKEVDGHQVKNDLTFAEVDTNLARALKEGKDVPDHIKRVLTQFEEAYNFAMERKMKPFCERMRAEK